MAKRTKTQGRKTAASKKDKATPKSVAAKPSDVMQVISAPKFALLVRNVKSAEADKNEAVGRVGQLVSSACEKDHLDKKAFGMYRSMARMSDNRRATSKACFDHYYEIGGLLKKDAEQGQMFARPEAGESADDESDIADDQGDVADESDFDAPEPEAEPETETAPVTTKPAKAAKEPKAPKAAKGNGSFAERLSKASQSTPPMEETSTPSLSNPRHMPSSDHIKDVADRAEQRGAGKPH